MNPASLLLDSAGGIEFLIWDKILIYNYQTLKSDTNTEASFTRTEEMDRAFLIKN